MGINNDDTDLVNAEALKQKARTDANLLGLSLGDRTLTDKGLMNIGRAVLVENKRQDDKKKKEEKERSEALKRVQEALEKHLAAIYEEIEKHHKAIEAIGELREKIRNGTFNKDDTDTRSLLNRAGIDPADISNDPQKAREKLDRVQTEREKEIEILEKEAETLRNNFEKAKTPEEKAAVVEASKTSIAWKIRVSDVVEHQDSAVIKGKELAYQQQRKLEDKLISGKASESINITEARTAELGKLESSSFLAASLDGDGSYTKGIGEKGLTSQSAFTTAARQTDNKLPDSHEPETRQENNKGLEVGGTPALNG